MKLLTNYNDYIVELKIIESLRTFPLFISKRLRDILSQIDHEISTELLSKHSDLGNKFKQTFIDIHDTKAGAITFTQPNKATQILGWDITSDDELNNKIESGEVNSLSDISDDNDLYQKYRSESRWGRFINATFPNKFQLSISGGQNKQDIESFVNLYKAIYNREDKFELLDIVNGMDIAKWYHCNYYFNEDDGTLGESCMKNKNEDYFEIYTSNPDTVSLIIMYNNNKTSIKARALLWTLSSPSNRKFMDRVYTNDYSDEQIFIDYAKQNNWIYKSQQSMGVDVSLTDPSTNVTNRLTVIADIYPDDYDYYPYFDTMAYLNPNDGKLSNKKNSINAQYELVSTEGDRFTVDGYEEEPSYVYSKYYGEEINENDAKYCKFGDDWLREEDAIRVWNSDGENYAIPGHPDIVQSKFNDYNKYFLKSKCIWSDYLNTWIFNSSAKKVWADLERKNMVIDHKKRENNEFLNINDENWIMDLIEDGELIGEVSPKIDRPVGEVPRGWHRRIKFIDEDGNIFKRGVFSGRVED